ncbi:MAG TPA: 23S rRNA (adenine(2503)-C(2))-methyltransferase RlmN [Limnochordales bacterium]
MQPAVDRVLEELPLGLVRPVAELVAMAEGAGQPAFRGRQVHQWVFRRGVSDPQGMTNLPASFRGQLQEPAWAERMRVLGVWVSRDGTHKALLGFSGPARPAAVEAVWIPQGRRRTLCVSTQVGCPVGCPFCATGQMGLVRQLTAREIAGQALWARQQFGCWPTHVVFMGMGEPLANFGAVRAAIELMRAPDGFGIGVRRLTISTAGLVPGILALAREARLEVGLAVSLHAPDDGLRDRLVPVNRAYPLDELLQACREYQKATRRRITFEYVLLRDVNDRPFHARELARRLRGLLCHVNLIPYNPVPGLPFDRPAPRQVACFARRLQQAGVPVTVRWSRGGDIEAACGQLRAAQPLQPAASQA